MTLWDWAVHAYARPGTGALCLTLQDEHGQCVSFLIWAAWSAKRGAIDSASLSKAAALARDWETTTLKPLRAIRRALKQPADGVDAAGQDRLRARIQDDELAAERLLLEALEILTPPGTAGAADLGQVLRDAADAWGVRLPPTLLKRLIEAFSAA